jgi:hypothetical protein
MHYLRDALVVQIAQRSIGHRTGHDPAVRLKIDAMPWDWAQGRMEEIFFGVHGQ